MKKVNALLKMTALVLLSVVLLISCNKEGPQGIPGPPGNGGVGPVGPVGPAGKDGSLFLTGTGMPDSTTGNTGDYYLDKKAGKLYGPKTTSGWGSPFTFSGDAGGKIYGGKGTPDSTLGNTGDFYLDTTNYLLYGPKLTASSWGPGLMLKGSGGNSGVTGYVISNPYNYLTNDSLISHSSYSANNVYLKILYDDENNFNLWTSMDSGNNMIAVYFKRKAVIYSISPTTGIGEFIGYKEEFIPANQPFRAMDSTGFWRDLTFGFFIEQDGLEIDFGGDFCSECSLNEAIDKVEGLTNLESIEIFVISPSAFQNITPPQPPSPQNWGGARKSDPGNNAIVRQLVQPYLH